MADNKTPLINPWDTLSTVTTFDRGNDARSTAWLNSESSQNNKQIVSIVPAPTFKTSSLLIESLIQQICVLFEADSVRRNKLYFAICDRLHELKVIDSSYNIMELEEIRGQYQQALYHLFTVARAATGCENIPQVPSSVMTNWSRYHREFQEVGFIAAGGFGNVFKALNRLDGIEYAVKKIIVRPGRVKTIMQHLEEVKTLAKLNHTNIVSYKSAWIEPMLPSLLPRLVTSSHSQNNFSSIQHIRKREYISCSSIQSQQSSINTECSQSPKGSDEQNMLSQHNKQANYKSEEQLVKEHVKTGIEKTNSNSISFRSDGENQDNRPENNTNYSDGSNSNEEYSKNKMVLPCIPQMNRKYTTLYIQMALCEKTLQQWLDERIEMTSQTMIIAILTQILCGLDYIHSRGIVHHDIKPSNIFISTTKQFQIQLGDFGLACPLQRENHHSILGTQMYAAPEQLQGKCDPKSDIYSLGVVLLELLIHTRTQMERVEIINSLKRGQIPTKLTATYPKWAYIVSQLVQEDPEKRPSTHQLLQDLNEDKDMTIMRLKNDIIEKNDMIKELQEKISILEEQIVKNSTSLQDT